MAPNDIKEPNDHEQQNWSPGTKRGMFECAVERHTKGDTT